MKQRWHRIKRGDLHPEPQSSHMEMEAIVLVMVIADDARPAPIPRQEKKVDIKYIVRQKVLPHTTLNRQSESYIESELEKYLIRLSPHTSRSRPRDASNKKGVRIGILSINQSIH